MNDPKTRTQRWGLLALTSLLVFARPAVSSAADTAPQRLRVLLFSGRNNHDWQQTTPVLQAIYQDSGRFAVDVSLDPAHFPPARLADYDVLVSNWSAWPELKERSWGPALEQAVLDFVRGGKGLVVFHAATATFHAWPEFLQLAGSTWDLKTTGHGQIHSFKVVVKDPDHPVMRGLPDFYITDELWHRLGMQAGAHVLATAFSDQDRGGSGQDEPVVMGTEWGQGRGFNLVLGHDAVTLRQPGWRALMLRGTEWAATGRVTLPVPSDLPTAAHALSLAGLESEASRITVEPSRLLFHAAGKLSLRYHYVDVPYKPYLEHLFSPAGLNVLRDAPYDHLHHHGLMYAMRVDGVDFWVEAPTSGRQWHQTFVDTRFDTFQNQRRVRFTEQLDWRGPTNTGCLLKERRTVAWIPALDPAVTFVEWESQFEVPPGRTEAVLTGDHYHGLGMRFIRAMDAVGEFRNAAGTPGAVFRGEERLVDADWCAYTAKVEGRPVTVAMMGHPNNPRHPTTWFTMPKPFAYLSATLRLHERPLKMTAGEPLTLKYGVAVWDGEGNAARIQELYARWIKP